MRLRPLIAAKTLFVAAMVASVASVTNSACAAAQSAPQRPAITGVAFARFYETDPIATQHFYTGTLGYERIQANGMSEYPVNAAQWIETVPHIGPEANNRMAAVGFTTRDAAALQRYLAAKGYPAAEPLHNGQFSVRDPEGSLIYFVQQDSNQAVAHAAASPHATARRIIHVGFTVRDAEKENIFWRQTLGFKPYWHGGMSPDRTDWVSQQVPDGVDWLEYMLNNPADGDLRNHGGANHVSLGTASMDSVIAALKANGCIDASCGKSQFGHDGKVQLNLHDPDLTRIEFMEFKPTREPCCSPITGTPPTEAEVR